MIYHSKPLLSKEIRKKIILRKNQVLDILNINVKLFGNVGWDINCDFEGVKIQNS